MRGGRSLCLKLLTAYHTARIHLVADMSQQFRKSRAYSGSRKSFEKTLYFPSKAPRKSEKLVDFRQPAGYPTTKV